MEEGGCQEGQDHDARGVFGAACQTQADAGEDVATEVMVPQDEHGPEQ